MREFRVLLKKHLHNHYSAFTVVVVTPIFRLDCHNASSDCHTEYADMGGL